MRGTPILLAAAAAAAAPAAAQVSIQEVVAGGDAAPGTGSPGESFAASGFHTPTINNLGQVAFRAAITGSGFQNTGLWSEAPGALALVAREGTPAPGLPQNYVHIALHSAIVNDAGQVVFHASVGGGGQGIWRSDPGAPSSPILIAAGGEPIPGDPAVSFTSLTNGPALTNDGRVGFSAGHSDGNRAVWLQSPGGALQLVAVEGGPAPGPPGTTYGGFGGTLGEASFSTQGHVAFQASLAGVGGAIVGGHPDAGLALLVQQGQVADGTGGATFDGNQVGSAPCISVRGEVAFRRNALGKPGIWKATAAGHAAVAYAGDPAPGTAQTFQSFGTPAVNARGQVAFSAALAGGAPGDEGIWVLEDGALELVARTGDPVPDAPGLSFVAFLSGGINFPGPSLNDPGQLAFMATLSDGERGLYARTADGVLLSVAREGGTFQGQPITLVSYSVNSPVAPVPHRGQTRLNDLGTLAFVMRLGGAGPPEAIYRATLPPPACPPGALLCAGAGAVSVVLGGTQTLSVDAGAGQAGAAYLILGSASGGVFGAARVSWR